MMVNAPLLENTMSHIRAYPELHTQDFFFEQTDFGIAACFAGRACLLSGLEAVLSHGFRGSVVITPDGGYLAAWVAARELLGLSHEWCSSLFSPINTTYSLELKVKDILNGLPHPADDYFRRNEN